MHWIALRAQPDAPADAGSGEAVVLTDPLRALGWWALRYTPRVALLRDAVLLEVSGSTRLWGGRAALLRRIYTEKKPLAQVQYAQGATSLIAYARLLATAHPPLKPDELPLHTLLAAQAHLGTLTRLGCTTWGQLRALPRGGLVRRFAAPLVDALDQAYGQRPDVYPWLTLPEVFVAKLELPSAVENATALLFGARRLLAQLQVWLRLRQQGVLALELAWQMDARRNTALTGRLVLRVAEPAQDTAHLQRLLAERLRQVTLAAPALWLRLRSLQTQPLPGGSASLLPDEPTQGDSLTQLLERLSARLGADKVLGCQLQEDHRPEQMQAWLAAVTPPDSIAACACTVRARGQKSIKKSRTIGNGPDGPVNPLLPTWLLPEPLRLVVCHGQPQYHGPLTLLAGPQRLETGWWAGAQDAACLPGAQDGVGEGGVGGAGGAATLRDYFVARSCSSVLLWIYRLRLTGPGAQAQPCWYLHGVFA